MRDTNNTNNTVGIKRMNGLYQKIGVLRKHGWKILWRSADRCIAYRAKEEILLRAGHVALMVPEYKATR